jgi:hypothetical protein
MLDGVPMKHTPLLAGVAAVVALALGGCGGGAPDSTVVPSAHASDPGAVPRLDAPMLFSVERRRGDAAIGETLSVANDGTGIIVRAAGGGGRRTERCLFGTSLMDSFRREAPQLPAPPTPKPRKVADPAVYLVTRGPRHAVFMDGAIPSRVRPFLARVTGVLAGRWGSCVTLRSQR